MGQAMKQEEHVHKAVATYLKLQYPNVIFFSEPSGLRVSIGQAKKLKAIRSYGKLPDLFIAEPRGQYCGLFIEIKSEDAEIYTKGGNLKKSEHLSGQAAMIKRLLEKGFMASFGVGFDNCKLIIDAYMGGNAQITHISIENAVCKVFGVKHELLKTKSRVRDIVEPRHLCMALSYTLGSVTSNKNIGYIYSQNHSTVNHARKTIKDLVETSKTFNGKVLLVLKELGLEKINII